MVLGTLVIEDPPEVVPTLGMLPRARCPPPLDAVSPTEDRAGLLAALGCAPLQALRARQDSMARLAIRNVIRVVLLRPYGRVGL